MSSSDSSILGLPSGLSDSSGFDDFLSDTSKSSGIEFLSKVAAAASELEDTAKSKKTFVHRDREVANTVMLNDYFVERPKYDAGTSRGRFRLPKDLFLTIVTDISMDSRFSWFHEGYDGRLKKSFTSIQKCTSAIRQLATDNPPDEYDEYLSMSARTARECLEYFCNSIIMLYGKEFLHRPTSHDIARLYNAHETRWAIPGMIGSIDCTHVVWRMCPTSLRAQFMRDDHQYPTIMMEAVVSHDLWFWHAYCAPSGSNNDINVLNQYPLFNNEMHGTAPECPFQVNGREYKRGYYLADGIYPTWSVFVKSFSFHVDSKEKRFKKVQESARKDVERGFGVLKSKWGIINRPQRSRKRQKIQNVVCECIILHNMILKHDENSISPSYVMDPPTNEVVDDGVINELRDQETHFRLRYDLVKHFAATLLEWARSDSKDDYV